ncbi:sulfur reduction protein DsrE [Candidatus Micrarchaeota archaeon CG10_big_fil_rev_8_21_14_0_10_45_29]|nr:MAG: sulfur reduction protein DsrE [Candidatus Micrarchaeota archaeon CG10_big_fil_rev_8_21_14_0_10_45_29]
MGIIIGAKEPEVAWNAFRLANVSLKAGHEVKVFLINSGVEAENISDGKHDVKGQISQFLQNKGIILACGTCLKAREKGESASCPISTMNDLLKMVEESDKILTFG